MNFAKRREIVNTAVTLVAADVDCGSNPIIAADRQSAESSARAVHILTQLRSTGQVATAKLPAALIITRS